MLLGVQESPTSHPTRSIGVVLGGFSHDGQMNGPSEPTNNWAGAEQMGLVEASGLAADLLEFPERGVEAAIALGVDHVVTGLEWARLSPTRESLNEQELERNVELVHQLQRAEIEPVIRLVSDSIPAWAGEEFWLMPGSPETFCKYAQVVIEAIGPTAARFVSIADPVRVALAGWLTGEAPPFRRGAVDDALCVLDNLLTAHLQLSAWLNERGGLPLGLELSQGAYDLSGAIVAVLDLASEGCSIEEITQAVTRGRETSSSSMVTEVVAAIHPLGLASGPSWARADVTRFLQRPVPGRFLQTAVELAERAGETDVSTVAWPLQVSIGRSSSRRLLSAAQLRPTNLDDLPPLDAIAGAGTSFIDGFCQLANNGVVSTNQGDGGIQQFFEQRARTLQQVEGPLRYTYDSLVDGYRMGTHSLRTGLIGLDRSRGRRGVTWLDTNAGGEDAAGAFRAFAARVRSGS
ncbi:MAG: family 1 glycosylhydrolase [Actinomycetota bacterium]